MANLKFQLVTNDEGTEQTLTLFHDGQALVATDSHPSWEEIRAGVLAGDESVADLFDVGRALALQFSKLSERVSLRNAQVCFDGDVIDNSITKQIVNMVKTGQTDYAPLVAFIEKVYTNPQAESREQLFTWLDRGIFSITPEGDLIAYKSVRNSDRDGFSYESITAGKEEVSVDGKVFVGRIPQNVGSVVEMPRSVVAFDPNVSCSVGLHVSDFSYANTWNYDHTAVLMVVVNPRDVVSVPRDSSARKVRTCRYTVAKVVEKPVEASVHDPAAVEDETPETTQGFKAGDRVRLVADKWIDTNGQERNNLVEGYKAHLDDEGTVTDNKSNFLSGHNTPVNFDSDATFGVLWVAHDALELVEDDEDDSDEDDSDSSPWNY